MKNPDPRIQASPNLWQKLAPQARRMRQEATPAEELLWQALRRSGVRGFKFRRQHVIGSFIVGFYCVGARLVVEVDGSIHDEQVAADRERQAMLESLGLSVIRFTNIEVMSDLPSVLDRLELVLQAK